MSFILFLLIRGNAYQCLSTCTSTCRNTLTNDFLVMCLVRCRKHSCPVCRNEGSEFSAGDNGVWSGAIVRTVAKGKAQVLAEEEADNELSQLLRLKVWN